MIKKSKMNRSKKLKTLKVELNSKIAETKEDKIYLMSIFDDKMKTIVGFKLLFRASEHNFAIKAFHEHCDGIPHTILLVKTNH